MGNLACIKIRLLSIIGSLGYYKSNFQGVHIFRRCKKRELRENMYNAKNIYIHSIQNKKTKTHLEKKRNQ